RLIEIRPAQLAIGIVIIAGYLVPDEPATRWGHLKVIAAEDDLMLAAFAYCSDQFRSARLIIPFRMAVIDRCSERALPFACIIERGRRRSNAIRRVRHHGIHLPQCRQYLPAVPQVEGDGVGEVLDAGHQDFAGGGSLRSVLIWSSRIELTQASSTSCPCLRSPPPTAATLSGGTTYSPPAVTTSTGSAPPSPRAPPTSPPAACTRGNPGAPRPCAIFMVPAPYGPPDPNMPLSTFMPASVLDCPRWLTACAGTT